MITLYPECTPNWYRDASLMQAEIDLLRKTLSEVRAYLNIPDRPSELDDLYHAQLTGVLKGRIQMAANLIDSPIIALEAGNV